MKHSELVKLMGSVVVVERELVRQVENRIVWWEPHTKSPRPGWVIGYRVKQGGTLRPGWADEPTEFDQTAQYPCLLVTYWPTYNPVCVPMDGWKLAAGGEKPYMNISPWTDRDRASLRTEMRDWPRDKNGRWKKKEATKLGGG